MATFLFNETVFGPIHSRRLGNSLGVNLLPKDYKYCNYNCIYCECGWTFEADKEKIILPKREDVKQLLVGKLKQLKKENSTVDSITFAGNGEPTIHPQFSLIIEDTIKVRNEYFPEAKITVLSNATQLSKRSVIQALKKVDNNILKLDAGSDELFQIINLPKNKLHIDRVVDFLAGFNGGLIVQTMFLRGKIDGKAVDNTTDEEVSLWIEKLKRIKPKYVMMYSIDRDTPAKYLVKIEKEKMREIACKVEAESIHAEVY